jgi:hypothetical protein
MRRSQSWCWSVLGPHGIGKHQSWAGTSGHSRYVEAAGWRMFIAPTWDAAALQRWVRIPPHGCRGPAALANDAGVTEDEPHPAAEVVPSPAGPSHVHPHRPCPKRALSIGRQRSFTDNKGRCAFPPSCRITPYGAARGSFPSLRCPGSCRLRSARVADPIPGRGGPGAPKGDRDQTGLSQRYTLVHLKPWARSKPATAALV